MSEMIIYKTQDGQVQLDVNLAQETVWLSQQQMAVLFGTKRQAISKHLKNIFNSGELEANSVRSKMEHTAADGKRYHTLFYSLDAIISVGYRVNSSEATQFRIWATQVLKEHLVRGYSLYEKRLSERGLEEMQQALELLQKTLVNNDLIGDIGIETLQLIMGYAKTWRLLLAYDENALKLPEQAKRSVVCLDYTLAKRAIQALAADLAARSEASTLFAHEREDSFKSILSNIEQTFDGEPLYKTIEERAAHLIYFTIKDHPFSDGNKRIGCLIFLLYLKLQNAPIRLNNLGLVALALLIAESHPQQKDIIIRLIVNLLTEEA